MVAVFPEGISHDETTLQPLKTGAARIALEAVADGGAEDLATVAVGLVYDAKARFRSRALVRVGEPVAVTKWAEDYRRDEWATVRAAHRGPGQQLSRVNPSFASWTQATQLSWIAEVVVRAPGGPGGPGSAESGLADGGSDDVALAHKVEVAARLAATAGRVPVGVGGAVRCLRRLRTGPEPARGQ